MIDRSGTTTTDAFPRRAIRLFALASVLARVELALAPVPFMRWLGLVALALRTGSSSPWQVGDALPRGALEPFASADVAPATRSAAALPAHRRAVATVRSPGSLPLFPGRLASRMTAH